MFRFLRILFTSLLEICDSRRSLAILFDARHPVLRVRIEERLNLMLTLGKDRVLKVRIRCFLLLALMRSQNREYVFWTAKGDGRP